WRGRVRELGGGAGGGRRREVVDVGRGRRVGWLLRPEACQRVELAVGDPVLRDRAPGGASPFELAALDREPLLVAARIAGDLTDRRVENPPQRGAVGIDRGPLAAQAYQQLLPAHQVVPGLDAGCMPRVTDGDLARHAAKILVV